MENSQYNKAEVGCFCDWNSSLVLFRIKIEQEKLKKQKLLKAREEAKRKEQAERELAAKEEKNGSVKCKNSQGIQKLQEFCFPSYIDLKHSSWK